MPKNKNVPYSDNDLFGLRAQRSYTGDALREIAFPLGGIGTGNVSLGGRGQLRDWEIFNRPGKGRILPYTFPAIYTRTASGEILARVLESKLQPPFVASSGMLPERLCGLPRLEHAEFEGEYPFAYVDFKDKKLPVSVKLTAFNPFIPLNEKDSAIPTAIFLYKLTNHSNEKLDATICWSMMNACGYDGTYEPNRGNNAFTRQKNEFIDNGEWRGIKMTSTIYPEGDIRFGSMALVTPAKNTTHLEAWTRSGWWDDCQKFWDDFKSDGELTDNGVHDNSPDGVADITSLGIKVALNPGETAELPFILTWYFPNRDNYWDTEEQVKGAMLRNRYGDFYKDAVDVASYVVNNLPRLEKQSEEFKEALYKSTLPEIVLDAAGANMSIMRTNTGLWLDDDRFYGFEGLGDFGGCCPMNCTHVWNYEQAVAHLFPRLERTMRITDYCNNTEDNGRMAFRTKLPLDRNLRWQFHAAADGQMGCILKVYREFMLSGDLDFVKQVWPGMKKTMDYAWNEWDKDQDGVIEGIQHNTYDIEFHGPNTMMGTFYLGALKAMDKLATVLGEADYAGKCRDLYEKGRKNLADKTWNGEYFIQIYDPEKATHYQFGAGCLSDQLLGQYFCEVVGLGDMLPEDMMKSALAAIFKYNWKSDLTDHQSVQRTYALNNEAGLLLCTWPNGGRPAFPFTYADEVWTGIEYQVAAHLIYKDMLEEGLAVVKGARSRHNGIARNPWDEFECGHHYARAMASWALVLALSGYHYSAPEKLISFAPKVNAGDFHCFYSTGSGWGTYSQKTNGSELTAAIEVAYGELDLSKVKLHLPKNNSGSNARASIGGREVGYAVEKNGEFVAVTLTQPAKISAGEALVITVA